MPFWACLKSIRRTYARNHVLPVRQLSQQSSAQSNQIWLAVGDGNFDPSRFAWLADTLNNVRYKIQLKLTDA